MIKFPISFDKFYVRLITPEGYKPKIFPKIVDAEKAYYL